eukprot:scaffold35524_cov122-Skeletonema_dohrnii-CCMP3373.AAC.1
MAGGRSERREVGGRVGSDSEGLCLQPALGSALALLQTTILVFILILASPQTMNRILVLLLACSLAGSTTSAFTTPTPSRGGGGSLLHQTPS